MDMRSLVQRYAEINGMMQREEWEELDEELCNIDVEITETVLLLGWLRLTFLRKENLGEWEYLRDAVALEFQRRDLDYKVLMHGLLKEEDD